MSNKKQIELVFRMWDTLDTTPVQEVLSQEVEYVSSWVLMSIHGKNNVINFLDKKFETIRNGRSKGLITIEVHVITILGIEDEDFIQIEYRIDEVQRTILIRVVVKDQLIVSIILFPKSEETIITIKY